MNTLQILKDILLHLESYSKKVGDDSLMSMEGFLQYLNPQQDINDYKSQLVTHDEKNTLDHQHKIDINIERIIAQHLIIMNRYIKFYSRTAFSDSRIKTLEEFSFLMTVVQFQQIPKSELIKRNITEKSSGIEIINRMIKNGMLMQVDNPNDMRSQMIQITDMGKGELYKIFKNMDTLGHIATAPLNDVEKAQLAKSLKKLDEFHYSNYCNKDLKDLEDYLNQKHNS